MTLSADDRGTNHREALVAFLDRLGDQHLALFEIRKKDLPRVLKTTWVELMRKGFLVDESPLGTERLKLTCSGYVAALEVSGRSKEPGFLEDLRRLCAALKNCVKRRADLEADFKIISLQCLVEGSGLSKAFALNAIDCELIERVFRQRGAKWTDCKSRHFIKVPSDVGIKLAS